jgi:hypothetical protein
MFSKQVQFKFINITAVSKPLPTNNWKPAAGSQDGTDVAEPLTRSIGTRRKFPTRKSATSCRGEERMYVTNSGDALKSAAR